jgi:cytochrome c peroxidase
MLSGLTACQCAPANDAMVKDARNFVMSVNKPITPPNFVELIGRTPTADELELGRLLFNDTILSRNNDTSCATCHLTNHGFADGNSLSVGALGRSTTHGNSVGRSFGKGDLQLERGFGDDGLGFITDQVMFRNTLSTVNVAYRIDPENDSGLLHDGRFGNLFFQVLLPIHTPEELCGRNPLPDGKRAPNQFRAGGPLFKDPVRIFHSHTFDPISGQDLGSFNAQDTIVEGAPSHRPNGSISVPTRNECLAIAVAKVRSIPEYREIIKRVYGDEPISDRHVARALATFILSHVAIDTPFDRFLKGDDSALTSQQMRGMVAFHTPLGQSTVLGGITIRGAGCVGCHSGPEFGGKGFASLGVRSDRRSSLARPSNTADPTTGFFSRRRVQRGLTPACHIQSVTLADSGGIPYAPDIGRANATFRDDDCFKFRIPPLRNVIETFPYFHHGTARGQGSAGASLEERALSALKDVIRYHLRGPQDTTLTGRLDFNKIFFDDLFQYDAFVPFHRQTFRPEVPLDNSVFPYEIDQAALDDLTDFVAYGIEDASAMKRGALGNDVSHPTKVPSGFEPTISRDAGLQIELPPAMSH